VSIDTTNVEQSLVELAGALGNDESLIKYIDGVTNNYDIETAIYIIKEIRNYSRMNSYNLFGAAYKPFYVLIRTGRR